jgi:hypothetical protein
MNKQVNRVVVLAMIGVMAGGMTAMAAEKKACQELKIHPAKAQAAKVKKTGIAAKIQELTLTGIIAKREMKVAGKNRTGFVLITASGEKLRLPVAKNGARNTAAPAVKLATFINQNVKVVALGTEVKKGEKTTIRIRTVKTVEKVAAVEPAPVQVG